MEAPSVQDVAAATGGRYEIEGVFAQGGMGTVYAARHRQLGSRLAIKVLPPEVATSAVRLARFKREAALAANLSHPHIVPVFEFDVQHDMAYLVMPFVEGESLASYLAQHGPLSYAQGIELLRTLGGALGFAHDRGIVHRDIKPANILREEATGRWLITDFGVAHKTSLDDTEITQSGAVVGTPAYMAPEQASGLPNIDGRADLYALAAVAYEALTGTQPNPHAEPMLLMRRLRQVCPDIGKRAARVLTAPLALSRDARPASAEAWLAEFNRMERREVPAAPVIVTTLLLAAVAGWLVLSDSEPTIQDPPAVAVFPFLVDERVAGSPPLDSLLTQAFDWQLRYLPDHRVLGPTMRQHPVARAYGARLLGLDTMLSIARDFGATLAVAGRAVQREQGEIFVQIQLHDVLRNRLLQTADTVGAVDDLDDLVASLVIAAFAEPVAQARTGWATSIPQGLDAFSAYWRGHRAFRHGAYPEAIDQFDRVIQLDSTFAPAHFHRVLAVMLDARPTQATSEIRTALDAATRYRAGLDPTSQQILEAYEVLVRDGDVARAETMFGDIVLRRRNAADAWFVLGYIQFFFRSLLGSSIGESKFAFEQALNADPNFAAALLQLATIAAIQNDEAAGRRYVRRFLALDSTSMLADLARMGDSLLYQSAAAKVRVLGSIRERPTPVLELLSLAAGSLHPPPGTRPLADAALLELWTRAGTPRDRGVAFRMRMAHLVATGRLASADSLVAAASRLRLEDHEVDRWTILRAVTSMSEWSGLENERASLERLNTAADPSAEILWLITKWYLQYQPADAPRAEQRLTRIARDSATTSPHARSLLLDIEATRALAAADTAQALALWESATRHYSIEAVPFGLTASLWPLRLVRARVALVSEAPELTLEIALTFDAMAGFVDQVAWPEILQLRAEAARKVGQPVLARRAYEDILAVLETANGAGVTLRRRVEQVLASLDP